MTYPMSLTSMFQSVGLSYGPTIPLVVLAVFVLLALPAIFRPSVRAEAIGYAAYCHLAQMMGILLMTAGALPSLYAVFAQQPLAEITYLGLLIVFAAGGGLFLWHDARLRAVDPASKAIPAALFLMTWKFVGLLVTVFAALSFALRLMFAAERMPDWWVMHLVMLLYGLVLSWFTLNRNPSTYAPAFTSTATSTRAPAVSKPIIKKPLAAKKKSKKRK